MAGSGGMSGSDLRVKSVRHTALVPSGSSSVLLAIRLRPIMYMPNRLLLVFYSGI
jgi:hypothetical protein